MANYIKQYITLDEFNTLQKHGLQYTGFITGVGYTYSSSFAIAPAHMQIQRESPFVKPGLDKYILGKAQYLDISPEAIARSYNVKPEDIAKKIVTTNPQQGSITVNMGNQNYITVPIDNSNIKIDVFDDGVEQIVNINVIDTITNKPSRAKYKMIDVLAAFNIDFKSLGDKNTKVAQAQGGYNWGNNVTPRDNTRIATGYYGTGGDPTAKATSEYYMGGYMMTQKRSGPSPNVNPYELKGTPSGSVNIGGYSPSAFWQGAEWIAGGILRITNPTTDPMTYKHRDTVVIMDGGYWGHPALSIVNITNGDTTTTTFYHNPSNKLILKYK